MSNEKDRGANVINPLKALQKQIFTKGKLCCQSGGTSRVLYILSCFQGTKLLTTDVYCHQLDKLNDFIKQKRPELVNRKGVVFHHDNARLHTNLVTRQKLLQLGWDVLPHPPYSPDIAPSDYHLFRSLQNALNGKTFAADEDVKLFLELFFAEKDKNFFERRIMKLPERWQNIIEQNGQYIF